MKVLLVGQGYVGLPVSMAAVDAGFHVTGFDTDVNKTGTLAAGGSHVEDIAPSTVRAALDSGRYRAVSSAVELDDFDVAVITVPTPLTDGAPDLGAVEAAAAMVGGLLRTGGLVVLESTTWPGTTTEVVGPILEASAACTVARGGVWPATTQVSHTAFMAGNSLMLARKICARRILVLSLPAWTSRASMAASTWRVWPVMSCEPSPATWPAR